MEQINPADNRPAKKPPNIWLLITVILIILITATGAWAMQLLNNNTKAKSDLLNLQSQLNQLNVEKNQMLAQLEQLTNEKNNLTEELNLFKERYDTSDWLTYTNQSWGFSFKYPGDWAVISDRIPEKTSPDSYVESNLTEALVVGSNQPAMVPVPSLTMYINPAGWGDNTPNQRWQVEITDGGFKIVSEQVNQPDAMSNLNLYIIWVDNSNQADYDHFYMKFNQNPADQEGWSETVKTILATFQFNQ